MKLKFFKKRIFLLTLLFSAILIFISFSHILNFYFYHDDYTHLYKAQNNILSPFPYKFFSFGVPILYHLFGLNPKGYFVVGMILYFISAVCLFFLASEIFKNKILAFLTTLVFSAGFIGQASETMFIGDGIGTLPALPLVILAFYLYFKYLKSKNNLLLFIVYALTLVILEIAPHRYIGLIIPFIGIDWLMWYLKDRKVKNFKGVIFRNLIFLLIFFLIYHKSNGLNTDQVFTVKNLCIQMSNFWNFIFPSYVEEKLMNFPQLPILFIYLFLFIRQNTKQKIIGLVIFLTSLIFVILLTKNYINDPITQNEAVNGFLLVIITLISLASNLKDLPLIISLLCLSPLTIFWVKSALEPFDSTNRYFMAFSFVSAIYLVAILNRKKYKYVKDYLFVIVPVFLFIVFRLISAWETQSYFQNNYVNNFVRMYKDLKVGLPSITKQTLIYMEGSTKELGLILSDASRVGEYPTQAAFAVQYGVPMDYIIWPDTRDDIRSLMRKNNLSKDDIHLYLYNGLNLQEVSGLTRQMLGKKINKNIQIGQITTPHLFYEYKENSSKIYSLFPLKVTLDIESLENISKSLELTWEYDTYGSLDTGRAFDFKLGLNERKKVVFRINASGEYLKEIKISALDDSQTKLKVYNINISSD